MPAPTRGPLVDLARVRIERALPRRERYKYVHPRVEREGAGWKIVSPNCSRNIDPHGGEIHIAWFVPAHEGLWLLHARDHAQGCWRPCAAAMPIDAALTLVCEDPERVFWP
ncbi:MAG: hypothetical protein HZC37_08845 [Burkholderiales bacterium]|nr:hypothetical protein [Burkholderiales bacterium]